MNFQIKFCLQDLLQIHLDCDCDTLKFVVRQLGQGFCPSRLYNDSKLLHAKIREEAEELCESETKEEITWEAADVLYFTLVKCAKAGE